MEGTISLADYGGLLQSLRLFHRAAQGPLLEGYAAMAALGAAVEPRDFIGLLDADLEALGGSGGLQRDEPCARVTMDPAEALGWLWVVEGSALGGQLIHRALDRLFGREDTGRSYYRPPGDFPRRWRAVCHAVEAQAEERAALDRMSEGAVTAFACMEKCLARGAE